MQQPQHRFVNGERGLPVRVKAGAFRKRSFLISRYQSQNSCQTKSQSVCADFVIAMNFKRAIDGFDACDSGARRSRRLPCVSEASCEAADGLQP